MAYKKDVDIWYQQFQHLMREQGIDLNNTKDLKRIRVPGPNNQGSVALFSDGFKPTKDNIERLHQAAEHGDLYFMHKVANEPVQITANTDNSVSAYPLRDIVGRPPMAEVPIWYTAINVLTLGITDAIFGKRKEYKEQMKNYAGSNLEHIPFWKKAINFASRGYFFGKNLREQNGMERKQAIARGRFADTLAQEKLTWDKETKIEREKAAAAKREQKKLQKQERMKSMIKEVVAASNPQNKKQATKQVSQMQHATQTQQATQQTEPQTSNNENAGNYDSPAAKANMYKSQMAENYELIKDAFGPNGDGWGTIIKAATNIDHIAKEFKKNPELMEQAVLSEKKCQRAENLCTALRTIAKNGMEAKGKLMAFESSNMTKEEREKYIRDAVKMDLLQNTLQNSAYAKVNTNQAEAISKTSRLINNMRKDPEQSSKDMDRVVDSLGIVNKLIAMEPEELAIYLQTPEKMSRDIQNSMKEKTAQIREERIKQSIISKEKQQVINKETQKEKLQGAKENEIKDPLQNRTA